MDSHSGQPRATCEKRLVTAESDQGSAKVKSHSELTLDTHTSHCLPQDLPTFITLFFSLHKHTWLNPCTVKAFRMQFLSIKFA